MNTFLMNMLNISLMSSVFIIAVLIFRKVFKKAPKLLIMLMWAAVAIRLLCPVTINTKFGLLPEKMVDRQEKTITAPKQAEVSDEKQVVYVFMGNEDLQLVRNNPIEKTEKSNSEKVTQETEPVAVSADGFRTSVATEPVVAASEVKETQVEKNTISISLIVQIAYCVGVISMIVYGIFGYVKIRRRCATMIPIEKGSNIYICDEVRTGFIIDIFRPKIVLPSGLDAKTREHVVNHEKTHLKHKDNYWKPLGYLVLSLNWYNPLVWIAYISFVKDMELFCDESVIKRYNNSQICDYSIALLNLSTERVSMASLAFGEVNVKERIKIITTYKKPAMVFASAATAVALALTGCLMTNSKIEKNKETKAASEEEISTETTTESSAETTSETTSDTEATTEETTAETTVETSIETEASETAEAKKDSETSSIHSMNYIEFSGDKLADGEYVLYGGYEFDSDLKGITSDVSSYYYMTKDEIDSLKIGDTIVIDNYEDIHVETLENFVNEFVDYIELDSNHFHALSKQKSGKYYLEDEISTMFTKQIVTSKHIPIADDVLVIDHYYPYHEVFNTDYDEYVFKYDSLADFVSDLNSDKVWFLPSLHIVVKDGVITEIYINPEQHQPWKEA